MTIYALKVYQQLQVVVCKSKLLAIWSLLSWGIASLPDSKSLGSVLSAALCKIQANKHYTESLLVIVPKEETASLKGERSTVWLPFDCVFAHQK